MFILSIIILASCGGKNNPILIALESKNTKIKKIINNVDEHELQIIVSVINKNKKVVDYKFNLNADNYYYPASTVKLPISVFALEKINEYPLINIDTPYKIENDTAFYTIRKDINEIMVMSSNESYNRLFEFLGQNYINYKLNEKGMTKSKIYHRLETKNAKNLETKELTFFINDSVIKFNKSYNKKTEPLKLNLLKKGVGYINGKGDLVRESMDFSEKNYIPLEELHNLSKLLFFREQERKKNNLMLTENQISFLMKSMNLSPNEIGYNSEEYPDTFSNLLVYGDIQKPINGIKIYNKIGFAYGYVSETAFIETTKSSITISIALKVNNNQIFNDNEYEYEEIAFPFLAEFGREIIRIVNAKWYIWYPNQTKIKPCPESY